MWFIEAILLIVLFIIGCFLVYVGLLACVQILLILFKITAMLWLLCLDITLRVIRKCYYWLKYNLFENGLIDKICDNLLTIVTMWLMSFIFVFFPGFIITLPFALIPVIYPILFLGIIAVAFWFSTVSIIHWIKEEI